MIEHKKLKNGFEYIEVVNAAASAKIALQGAHIFEYAKKGEESLLWLSPKSAFEEGVAIRGGIPLCWPRFGSLDESMMQHGFARTSLFTFVSKRELNASTTEVHLQLHDSETSRVLWNHRFVLDVKIVISERLTISLETKNLDEKSFMITQALHTYFRVSQIENITIKGLENRYYFDTLLDEKHKEPQSITIDKEIDRVYIDTDDTIVLHDKTRKIELQTVGSASTIVWNPWREKCSKMSYMTKDAYKEFVCIESANAFDDFVLIKSKKTHTLHLTISFL
jgi:glucose-6-phosphate 1-epimerase